MIKILDKLERGLNGFIKALGMVSAVIMILLMFYVAADTIMRNVDRSFVGSNEVIVNVIVAIVFLGIGYISVNNAQIQIDVFKFLPSMDHVTLWITTIMYCIAGFATFKQAMLIKSMNITSSFLSIPRWPFLVVTGVGFILAGLGALCVDLRFLSSQLKTREEKKALAEKAQIMKKEDSI